MSLLGKLRHTLMLGKEVSANSSPPSGKEQPLELFQHWFKQAQDCGIFLPESMILATCGKNNRPSARVILLKEVNEKGFVFYTNYGSPKAVGIAENPFASLVFYWNVLQRQIRIEGSIEKINYKHSDDYFQSRGRGSRIGAWASRQSQIIRNRNQLEEQVKSFKEQFSGKRVPCPPFWGGYRLIPDTIEFWHGKADRLHDRFLYHRQDKEDDWQCDRLSP